jgi:hypothetical protein
MFELLALLATLGGFTWWVGNPNRIHPKKNGKKYPITPPSPGERTSPLPSKLLQRIHRRKVGMTGKYTVWSVNGGVIRDEVDVNFCLGGNPARYRYVPKGEIWVEEGDPKDVAAIAYHEHMETEVMIREGKPYEEAHKEATISEMEFRRKQKRKNRGNG